jgi:mRNA-degrading endonuclease toxin of MazEF toxin-antitoxin module
VALKRGEVWCADLAKPRGSEPADRRPVLIVQDDQLTISALSTVMVVDAMVRRLPARLMRSVDAGLRLALSLE